MTIKEFYEKAVKEGKEETDLFMSTDLFKKDSSFIDFDKYDIMVDILNNHDLYEFEYDGEDDGDEFEFEFDNDEDDFEFEFEFDNDEDEDEIE